MPWYSDFDVKLYSEQDLTMEGYRRQRCVVEPPVVSKCFESSHWDTLHRTDPVGTYVPLRGFGFTRVIRFGAYQTAQVTCEAS